MAVAYRSSSSAATGASGGTSLTVSTPSGVANGDVLLAVLAADYQSATGTYTVTAPTGWTALTSAVNVTAPAALGSEETAIWSFWKQAGSSEPSSYAFTIADGHGTAASAAISVGAFSGAAQTFSGSVTTTSADTGTTLAASGVAGALASDMVVILAGGQDSAKQSTNSMSVTGPSSPWTSVAAAAASATYEKLPAVTCLAYQTGVTTGGTFTYAGNTSGAWVQNIYNKVGINTGNTAFVLAPTANTTAGNTVVLVVSARTPTAGTTVTVTDTKSNTWTVDTFNVTNNNFVAIVSTRQNGGTLTTGDSVTITFNNAWAGSGCNVNVDEFYGLASASYTDGTAQANNSASSGNAGSITPTQGGDLMIAALLFNGTTAPTGNSTGTVGTYTTTGFSQPNGTTPKSLIYGYQFLAAGSGTAQQFDASFSSSNTYQGVSVAYKTTGAYNMGAVAVAININATLINDTDAGSGADAAGAVLVGNGDTATGTDSAFVTAVVSGAADTGAGAESGLSRVPVNAADASNASVDTATVVASIPAAETGSGKEVFQITSGGATLAFGNDFAAAPGADNATAALAGVQTDSATSYDTATIAVQGPIPSGYQRIIRIQPEVDNVTGS